MSDIKDEALPPSTTPSDLKVVVRDFTNEEAARHLEETILSVVRTLGCYMDLSRLDGVTVGIDYDAALASIDRGMPGLRPLTRSDTAEMQGVAMSPGVLRGDEVRTHLVFNVLAYLQAADARPPAEDPAGSGRPWQLSRGNGLARPLSA